MSKKHQPTATPLVLSINQAAQSLGVEEGLAQGLSAGGKTAMAEANRESYLSGIRVALERVDPTGRAAKQLRDLLAEEQGA